MKQLISIFFIFIFSLNVISSELELQSQDKQPGDVLKASDWNSIMRKIKSSNRSISKEMILGNWLCTSSEFGVDWGLNAQSIAAGWTEDTTNSPFVVYVRTNFPITFVNGTPGTWTSTETHFFDRDNHPSSGSFQVLFNTLYLSWFDIPQNRELAKVSFNLTFHGSKRFSAKKTGEFNHATNHFVCDKQN